MIELRVDDDVVDVALLDLTQHLTVGGARALADVHLHVARRRRAHQILEAQQTWKTAPWPDISRGIPCSGWPLIGYQSRPVIDYVQVSSPCPTGTVIG